MQKREYQTGLELTDKEWHILEPFLPEPPRSPKGGQVPAPNRACIEGIHYVNPLTETLAMYGLTWDAASRITAMNLDGESARYGYDATSQLTSATYDKLPEERYAYDANGNRKNFVTGTNNRLTSDGRFTYTYDGEGNRVEKRSKGSRTRYEWDHRNRLVKVVADGKTVDYTYDYLNRLIRRDDEIFVHDGWQVVCTLKNGKVKHRCFWGATQDELLAADDRYCLTDHLGTVRKIVDAKGKVVSRLDYSAFGELVASSGKLPEFRYTGKLFDETTGLQWNINRWYDPKAGRWISEDPIGFRAKDSNLFRYVRSNPIRHRDLFGLTPCSAPSDVGNRRGSTTVTYFNGERDLETSFSLSGTDPGDSDGAFSIAMFSAAFVAAAGMFDMKMTLAEILTNMLISEEPIPAGSTVAALLAKLSIAVIRFPYYVMIQYQCLECKCRTYTQWLAGIEENPNWRHAEKKWAKCDLSQALISNIADTLYLNDIKDESDLANIESRCRSQLSAKVNELCKK